MALSIAKDLFHALEDLLHTWECKMTGQPLTAVFFFWAFTYILIVVIITGPVSSLLKVCNVTYSSDPYIVLHIISRTELVNLYILSTYKPSSCNLQVACVPLIKPTLELVAIIYAVWALILTSLLLYFVASGMLLMLMNLFFNFLRSHYLRSDNLTTDS
jgi:hypothetical protein